jgi:hypothetical protein
VAASCAQQVQHRAQDEKDLERFGAKRQKQ